MQHYAIADKFTRLFSARHVAVLTAGYMLLAVLIWPARYLDVVIQSFLVGLISIVSLSIVCLCVIALFSKDQRPIARLLSLIRERGISGVLILVLFILGTSAYTTYKIAIPEISPFYADQWLLSVGRALPVDFDWRLAHSILPANWASPLVLIYAGAWTTAWFALVTLAAFLPNRTIANRYLSSMALVLIICGTVLAISLSSVGPIFYDRIYGGDQFAELLKIIETDESFLPVKNAAAFLFSNYSGGTAEIGSGISAAPSVHVAIATLNALFLYSINRWLGAAGWAFAAIIMFASVYTGWHYAIDGYISIAVVSLIWWLSGRSQAPAAPEQQQINTQQEMAA